MEPTSPQSSETPSSTTTDASPVETPAPSPRRRGFAAMDRDKLREIARRGAAASRANGTAHRFTAEEARAAGRKGGSAPHRVRGRSYVPERGPTHGT